MIKVCFVKAIELTDGENNYSFKRMKFYKLPDWLANELLEEGYCFEYSVNNEEFK